MRMDLLKCLAVMAITSVMMGAHAETKQVDVTAGVVGNYLGMQVGRTNVHADTETLPNSAGIPVLTKPSTNGFGLRLYWGYQFTDYLGLEGGYGFYSPATYNIENGNSPQIRIQALDLVAKGTVPLFYGISFFGKGGAALVFYKEGGLLVPNTQGGIDGSSGVTMRPEFGGGISFAFTPNMQVELTATRITSGGAVPNSDLISIGLSYHAVDLYCGQFMC